MEPIILDEEDSKKLLASIKKGPSKEQLKRQKKLFEKAKKLLPISSG